MDIAIYQGKNLHEAELVKIFKPKEYVITQYNGKYELCYNYWDSPYKYNKLYDELIIENGLIKLYQYFD